MQDIDLSNIDPLKWAEVRRRVAAVKHYLAMLNPTAADRERYAAMLDLGAHQFSNLVKAWSAKQDAAAVAPGMRVAKASRSRRDGVDPMARQIAREAIAELGAKATLPQLLNEIGHRCAKVDVTPPSRGTIWLLAVEARGADATGEPDGIVVARAHLRLPVDTGVGNVFPELVVASYRPSGRIIDIVMVRPAGDFDAHRLAEAIERRHDAHVLPIIAGVEDAKALARYLRPDIVVQQVTAAEATRALSYALGKRIGLVEISFRPLSVRPATVMTSGRDRAPSVEDAELAVIMALDRHNADLRKAVA